jgi:hypothetical protein
VPSLFVALVYFLADKTSNTGLNCININWRIRTGQKTSGGEPPGASPLIKSQGPESKALTSIKPKHDVT